MEQLEQISAALPDLIKSREIRLILEALPAYDLSPLANVTDFRLVERLMQMYGFFANAFIYSDNGEPEHRLPPSIAKPLYRLSQMVERPPILTYASYVLANWKRHEPDTLLSVDHLELVQDYLGIPDEGWFLLIHADIEARASGAIAGIRKAAGAAVEHDALGLERALGEITVSVDQMMKSFDRMPEGCHSDVYYTRVRPHIFGFNDVIYEGVEAFAGRPHSFRGASGAQSSIIPALVAGLGLKHEQTSLMRHLDVMRQYMPKLHREFISEMSHACIREVVVEQGHNRALAEAYNECLRKVMDFRKLHVHYVNSYLAQKVSDAVGTGGTLFMDWLSQLVQETETQLV